ncbi:hypothetical protein PENTCL1PPCAC_26188, partial [Pristionchus entomophagus]
TTMSYNSNSNNLNNYHHVYGQQESAASMDLGNAYTSEMKEMLETPIDLANYLLDEPDNDWPLEEPQMEAQPSEKHQSAQYYQEQFQMQQALYHDVADSHYIYGGNDGNDYSPNYDHQTLHDRLDRQVRMVSEVKTEPEEDYMRSEADQDEYMRYEKEASPLPSTSRQILAPPVIRQNRKDAARALEEYKPQTKARGYKIKQEEEKADPSYKLKRARNNDAVRKSRTKAKEQQMERDKELNFYKDKCVAYEKDIKNLKLRLSKYEKI